MGGAELISRIRQLDVYADTPILVLAARRSASQMASDLPSGAAAVIFKDIDIELQLSRASLQPCLSPVTRGSRQTFSYPSVATWI